MHDGSFMKSAAYYNFQRYLSKRFTVSKIWLSEDNLTWRVFKFSCTTATRVRNYFCYESDCDVRIKLNIFHNLGRNVTFLFAWKMAVYSFDSKAQNLPSHFKTGKITYRISKKWIVCLKSSKRCWKCFSSSLAHNYNDRVLCSILGFIL